MTNKSLSMSRRNVLKAAGISLALPWFESIAGAATTTGDDVPPKRFCALYFPYGVSLPNPDKEGQEWTWFPKGDGKPGSDFTFNKSLEVLEPVRDQITVLGGLSHPLCRQSKGHATGDSFLTGTKTKNAAIGGKRNSISFDQFMARAHKLGESTRFPSLALSWDGGVGSPNNSNTLSYTTMGQPIPSLNRPAVVFNRLFGLRRGSIEAQRRGLSRKGSHLDLLLDEAKSLQGRLCSVDQNKLDQYLTSVREVEQDVQRANTWLIAPPKVGADGLNLEADERTPADLIKAMFDLIVLAFQTDSTRFATYQLGSMKSTVSKAFPQLLGFARPHHALAHGVVREKAGAADCGKWDRYLAEHLGRFIQKLAAIEEGEGTLLDNTCILYGSSNSVTHQNRNYPLILAGGKSMGFKHNQYLRFGEEVPLSNLFVTIQKRMGVKADRFADSTGEIQEVLTLV